MKNILISAFFALFAGALLHAADVITLKDGTKLEGEISDEDADTYTIKIAPAGGGLAIPKIIRKSDVREVKKSGPDEAVFKELQKLVPPPDRLTAADYKENIGRGQAFLVRYPDSPYVPAVKEIMKTLEGEHQLAAKGALKFAGEWISPAARLKNEYEIDAKIELADMTADVEAGRFPQALRHFEKIQSDFRHSESFSEARAQAIEVLTAYRPAVAGDLARVESRIRKRNDELQRLAVNLRKLEEDEIERRDKAYINQVKAEQASGTKWFSLNIYHQGPLKAVLSNIDSTLKALENPEADKKMAGPLYREAWEAANVADYEGGKKLISELKSLKVPARYLAKLEKSLTPPESETKEKPTTNRPPAPEPEPTPPEEKEPEKIAGEENAPTDEGAATSAAANEETGKKGFSIQILLVVVLVAVIVVALLAAFGGKKQ